MRKAAVIAIAIAALSGCVPLLAAAPAVVGAYCVGVSEAGKETIRAFATHGVQLIHCERAP